MVLTKKRDMWGRMIYQIISRDYKRLRELEDEHRKLGRHTRFVMLDSCNGLWMLTVRA